MWSCQQTLLTLILLAFIFCSHSTPTFTFQSKLQVPEAGVTYGRSPVALYGRGFVTMISGYNNVPAIHCITRNMSCPSVYVHTTDSGYAGRGYMVWTQQAKLMPRDMGQNPNDLQAFGKWIVSNQQTLLVAAPLRDDAGKIDRGVVYVFNGTRRHWTQMQKLLAIDSQNGEMFGGLMSLHGNRVFISSLGCCPGQKDFATGTVDLAYAGAVYIYERTDPTLLTWTRQQKLIPLDAWPNQEFGRTIGANDENYAIFGSKNDDQQGIKTGSAYVFKKDLETGIWTQNQKLIAHDVWFFFPGREKLINPPIPLGNQRFFGYDMDMNGDVAAFGISREDTLVDNRMSVYVYNLNTTSGLWSEQQRLFMGNDSDPLISAGKMRGPRIQMRESSMLVSIEGPACHVWDRLCDRTANTFYAHYIFRTAGNGWSQQQRLLTSEPKSPLFYNPSLFGSMLMFTGNQSTILQSQMRNNSCLLIWMSDHFLDGWDTAVLTVRAPDTSNDTFHPHCDQVDPFYVRYCPAKVEDSGIYIIQVFAAMQARFYWEISWQVQVESTGVWYKGDYATKMKFIFDTNSATFSFYSAENLIDMDAVLNTSCFRCSVVTTRTWNDLQKIGGDIYLPMEVRGAPYYISDVQGHKVYAAGKFCDNIDIWSCLFNLIDGVYVMRLGGGLFGRETYLPHPTTLWSGCNATGTDRDQLIFRIYNNKCTPLQVWRYRSRCDLPAPIDVSMPNSPSAAPSITAAPSRNIFGNPYVASQMYERRALGVTADGDIDYSNDGGGESLSDRPSNVAPKLQPTLETIQRNRRLAEEEEEKRRQQKLQEEEERQQQMRPQQHHQQQQQYQQQQQRRRF